MTLVSASAHILTLCVVAYKPRWCAFGVGCCEENPLMFWKSILVDVCAGILEIGCPQSSLEDSMVSELVVGSDTEVFLVFILPSRHPRLGCRVELPWFSS